jgi:two-component system response regulator MprA
MTSRVLLADDEEAVRDSLERALRLERLDVVLARDGQEALDLLSIKSPDLVVLDISMPRVNGLEVCRRMRDTGDRRPVLMLTARDAIEDRVEGLDAGADDYLVKPFALAELKARVRALLRRAEAAQDASLLTFMDLRMDLASYDVFRGERRLVLTRTEFQLLQYFLDNPRQVLSRTQLFEGVWGYDFGATSNSLGVHIGYLRRKLEEGSEPRLLHTIRGVGYILREPQ